MMTAQKLCLLAIGAGVEACEGLKIARKMGLTLVVADGNPRAPGFEWADYTLVVSTYDDVALVKACQALAQQGVILDGVIAMCADVPVSVAAVADAFGLPGLSPESAAWVADKLLMKRRLQAEGVPIPGFAQVDGPEAIANEASRLGLPIVVKPVDSRGARGVLLIDCEDQFQWAFYEAEKESPSGRVMVEEYLPGPQVSTETLVDRGHCYTLGFSDRNYEWLDKTRPYMIENGGDAPSSLSADEQEEIVRTVESAALALNIRSGVAKGDMVLTDEGAKVIEIAGRLSGGYFSTTQIPLATGVNFIEQAIRLALGLPLHSAELIPSIRQAVAIRYLELPAGTVSDVTGEAEARERPGIERLSVFIRPGDRLRALENHTQRAGFAIATGETKEQAVDRALEALAMIRVTYVGE